MSANRAMNPMEQGRQVAYVLKGAWRSKPSSLALAPAAVSDLAPHLIGTGAGGLAWWKFSDSPRPHRQTSEVFKTSEVFSDCPRPTSKPAALALADSALADLLERAYRGQRHETFMHEIHLRETIATLRLGGIEPLLSKGWAVARLYPAPGLRPCGDIDLYVDPDRLEEAVRVLALNPHTCLWVDLHQGVPELPERSFADLWQRSRQIACDDCVMRILGPEDQLRHLCLHFARHGGWRPLWLCDIGAFLETLPAGFDWHYCLSGDARLSAWVRAMLGLAIRLLGAVETPQATCTAEEAWLDAAILNEWGKANPGDSHSRDRTPMLSYVFRPWQAWQGVRRRIPNPVETAFKTGAYPQAANHLAWRRLRYGWSRTTRLVRRLMSPSRSAVEVHVNE